MTTRTNPSIKAESIDVEARLRDLLGADKPLPQHKGKHTDDLWFKKEEFFVECPELKDLDRFVYLSQIIDGDFDPQHLSLDLREVFNDYCEFFLEHKDVTGKKVGLNQVHCTRYEVIVVDLSGNKYYDYDYAVIDPATILKKVLNKKGQHSHSAIECAQVNLNPTEVAKYGCMETELRAKIYEAYRIGEQNVKLKQFAEEKAKAIVDRATQDMKDLETLLND